MKRVLFACLLFPVLLTAQDTLIFRSGEKKAAKLKEIDASEVKYTKTGQSDGPVYVVYKDELSFIKYANGKIDSLYSGNAAKRVLLPSDFAKIKMEGKYLYYKSRIIDDFELKRMIENYPYQETKDLMLAKYTKMEMYRKKQKRGKALIITGCFFPVVGFIASGVLFFTQPFESESPTYAYATGFGLGVATVAGGIVLNISNKKKGNAEKFDISLLYNQMR